MGKRVLPKTLIEEIKNLASQGYSSMEIFDAVQEKARKVVASEAQLARCISGIRGRVNPKTDNPQATPEKSISIPLPMAFDTAKYQDLISTLKEETNFVQFEKGCLDVVLDILTNYVGFRDIEVATNIFGYSNPPFDFFGYKDEKPYLIEFKGSLSHFHGPKETQKRKLQELRKKVKGLNLALLQVRLLNGDYRIFFEEQMDLFFDGPQRDLAPVVTWIKEKLKKSSPAAKPG
jgi:hypothetical protein